MYTDNRELEYKIKKHLGRGEKLIWSGAPKHGIILRKADFILIPFSFLWGGFALFWEYIVIANDAPVFFAIFGIPFVAIGIYLIIGRFFYDAFKRKKTIYGLTNERIIILSGKKINSTNLLVLEDAVVTEEPDKSGSIFFGKRMARQIFKSSGNWPGTKQTLSIELIHDVKKVYDKLIEAKQRKYSSF